MSFDDYIGDSTPEINPIRSLGELSSIEPIEDVDWQPYHKEGPDVFWRFFGTVDFWGADPVGSIIIEKWRLLRRTPKGAWIIPPFTTKWTEERLKKLMLTDARKKPAYPTKQEAWDSFCIRLKHREGYWEREGERIAKLKHLVSVENAK